MHIKEFFNTIEHRFRNAQVLDDNLARADLIDWSDNCVGKMLYEIKHTQQVVGIECYVGDNVYAWGESVSDSETQFKTLPDIVSILRGLLESRNQIETITDAQANLLIETATLSSVPITSTVEPYKNTNKQFTVAINATIHQVVSAASMDQAVKLAQDRLKWPDHVKYTVTSESVEIKYQ